MGQLCQGDYLYYRLCEDNNSQRTTLKSIKVWKLDENGRKVRELDGDYLPDRTDNPYMGNGGTYFYYGNYFYGGVSGHSQFKQPMPDSDILVEVSYGDGRIVTRVSQYIVDNDGNETPAGEGFSATFSGTPYNFGDELYAFVRNNGSEIARDAVTENLSDVTKSNEVTAVSTDTQSQYYFYRRKNTTNVSMTLTMPDGYTANITAKYCTLGNGDYFRNPFNLSYTRNESGGYTINKGNVENSTWDITIRYIKHSPITVVQKTGGVVAEGNKNALGTVTLTHDKDNSANKDVAPFAGFNGEEPGRVVTSLKADGTSDKAELRLLSNEQTNTLTAAVGTKLKIEVKPDSQRIIKSVNAYVTKGGVESEFPLTASSSSYTSAVYTADDLVEFGDKIRIEVEYAAADKITVEVLNTDENGKLVQNNIGAKVTVKGEGALTADGAFQNISGSTARFDTFDVTTKTTVSTIGKTQLTITVDLPENSDYVVANVYAYQMDPNGNPITSGGLSNNVLPGTTTMGDFSDVRDYSQCTLTMPDSSVYIKVFIAKTAKLTVIYQARNDNGEFSTANIPAKDNTYLTCNNTSTQYGNDLYPTIVENKYNVGSYTLTNDPAERTVDVVENCTLRGNISFPRGYLIASVIATETSPGGETKNLNYSFSRDKYITKDGEYFYEADFLVNDMNTKAGYTYNVTVNLELATDIIFESYHTTEDGDFELNRSYCRAELNGVRTNNDPAYASTVPFASKTMNSSPSTNITRRSSLPLYNTTNKLDYFVLQDTTLTLNATPEGEDVVSAVKIHYEDAPETVFDAEQTGREGNTVSYSIPVKPALNRTMVVQVYFSADLTGNLTIINRMVDVANSTSTETAYIDIPAEYAGSCYTNIRISNESYSNPIYYEPNGSWLNSTKTSAPSISYKIMSSSSGSVTAYAGSGYILESCEISYDGGVTYKDNSSNSGSYIGTKNKIYSLGKNNFTSDKKIVIRNTYRKGADIAVYEHRDLNESIDENISPCLVTATTDDPTLPNGPLYIDNKRYSDSYSCGYSSRSFMIAENSKVSLTVYEQKDLGYIIDRVVLTKDGDTENAVTLTRDQFNRKFNGTTCELLWENMIAQSEYLTGSGYRLDIYYKADYVLIREECIDRDTGKVATCLAPGRVTFEVAWPDSNDLIKDRKGDIAGYADDGDRFEGSTNTGLDLLSNSFYVGLLEGGTTYNVRVTTNNARHRIKQIWYGESESVSTKYTAENFKADGFEEGLGWGDDYIFTFDKGKVTQNYYFKVIYEHYNDEVVEPLPQPEKNRGLLTINVYREKADGSGYEISTIDDVTLDFLVPDNSDGAGGTYDYTPKLYENEKFTPLTPREDNQNRYDFYLPHTIEGTTTLTGSAIFSLAAGTYVEPIVATPNDAYRLDRVVFINQSTGQSAEKVFQRSDGKYTLVTSPEDRRIKMTESNYVLNFYITMPSVEVGTNNSPGSPKGTVSLKASDGSEETTEVMTSTDYMKAFKFSTGSNLLLTATPLEDYEFAYILVGDTRTSMTVYDRSKITIDEETGAAVIDLGSHYDDVFVQIQFRSIINTNYSQINVSHYIKNESGEYELYTLDTGGKVHVMGTQSSTSEPFLINDTTYSNFDLTTEGTRSAEAVVGTSVSASVTAPENGIVSAFKVTYYDEKGTREYTVIKDETGAYKLPEFVGDDSTVSIEVYYDTGYRIYYHGNGASGAVPSDESVYYSGDSATVLGQGKMKKEHHTFKGWSLMSGSDNVDYKEGETVTFTDGDIHLYAVWEENAQYRVIYHADDKDGGEVPNDPDGYYLNDEATVLGNNESDPLKKTGYIFGGWSLTKADDTTVSCKAGDKITVSEENLTTVADLEAVHLYAVWTPTYTVTYDGNGSDDDTKAPTDDNQYLKDAEVTVLGKGELEKTGYTFGGWTADFDGKTYTVGGTFEMPGKNVTLTAIWNENEYKLVYEPGAGHDSATIPADESGLKYTSIKDGHKLSSQVPTDTGYTFAGWQVTGVKDKLNEGGTVPFSSFNNEQKTATATATWTINKHNVTYWEADGVTQIGAAQPYDYKAEVTVGKDAGTPKTFDDRTWTGEWVVFESPSTDADGQNIGGTGTKFKMPDNDVKLKAVYSGNTYTVRYTAGYDGSNQPDVLVENIAHGNKHKIQENTFSRTGYDFSGWQLVEPLNKDYPANPAVDTEITVISNVTYTATWKIKQFTVTYKDGYSSDANNDKLYTVDYGTSHAVQPYSLFTRTGYTLTGWQLTSPTTGYSVTPGESYNVVENVTYTALWTANKHTVKYEITIPSDITYTKPSDEEKSFGDKVDVKPNPTGYDTKKYTFSGWSTTDATIENSKFTMPDKDVTIRGSFTENGKVTLTYNGNGATKGTAPDPVSDYVEVVEQIKGKGDLEKTGYTFDGWNASPNGDGTIYAVDTEHTFTENTTIYAKWIPNEYHVRYYDINGAELTGLAEAHDYDTDFTVRGTGDIPTITGKEIVGWKFKGGKSEDADGKTITGSGTYKMPAGDVEFQAEYKDLTYTVTYQVSNPPSSYTKPATKTYKYQDNVTVAEIPNIEGYNFYGWESTDVTIQSGKFTMPAKDVVIKGRFTPKNQVTLSYDGNGATSGTVPASITRYDEVVTKISDKGNLERTGYTFTGWNDKANGTGNAYEINTKEYTFAVDTTLYAQWQKNNYQVEYYEADGKTKITSHTYAYRDLVNVGNGVIPTQIGEGKVWNGKWELINAAQTDADDEEINDRNGYPMPAETVRYKAVLDTKIYTVEYVMEGDIPDGLSYTPPVEATYNHGDTVNVASLPTGYDTNEYTFTGWTYQGSNSAYNGKVYAKDTANASFTITEKVTLKGTWTKKAPEPDKITVTYVSGVTGDDITHPSLSITRFEQVTKGNDYTVHDNNGWTNYVRPGYKFVNWKVIAPKRTGLGPIDNIIARLAGPANVGSTFSGGDTITALSEDITLEAQWEPIHYTVLYYGNGATGGTAPVDSNSYSYNDTAVVKDKNDLVKDGFTFKGWSTNPLGTAGKLYSPNDEIVMTSDVILYAIWTTETAPNTYRVFYDGNGATSGTVPEDNTIYNGGETVTVKDKGNLEKDGCTFKEWNTMPDGSGTSYNPNDTFIMPQNDVVLYAIWIDSSGNVILVPRTGESSFGTLLAINTSIFSLIAVAIITVRMLKKRREKAAS